MDASPDFGHHLQRMFTDLRKFADDTREFQKDSATKNTSRGRVDPNAFLRVRESVCVVGFDRRAVSSVKNQVGALMKEPFPIEGFHVKTPEDLKDGALLVPKLLMVARHCPGRKLLDEDGDEGQLDFLYDEAVEVKADVMLVYIDLPRSIYKPMGHMVHHPKLGELLFPTQPLLRRLAADNCLVTVTERSDLNEMQKNVIREWLTKPVNDRHPVYKVADFLSTTEFSRSGAFDFDKSSSRYYGSGPAMTYYRPAPGPSPGTTTSTGIPGGDAYNRAPEVDFQLATEHDPLTEKRRKKRKKEKREGRDRRGAEGAEPARDLMDFGEGGGAAVELNAFKQGMTNYGAFSDGDTLDQFV